MSTYRERLRKLLPGTLLAFLPFPLAALGVIFLPNMIDLSIGGEALIYTIVFALIAAEGARAIFRAASGGKFSQEECLELSDWMLLVFMFSSLVGAIFAWVFFYVFFDFIFQGVTLDPTTFRALLLSLLLPIPALAATLLPLIANGALRTNKERLPLRALSRLSALVTVAALAAAIYLPLLPLLMAS